MPEGAYALLAYGGVALGLLALGAFVLPSRLSTKLIPPRRVEVALW
jgi:hypothetical protein